MRIRIASVIASTVLQLQAARADSLSWRRIGGPRSLAREIVGLKSDMTDKALDVMALRACPGGYQSDNGVGFTKSDGAKWWRFTFFCLDPRAEGSPEAAQLGPSASLIAFPGTASIPTHTTIIDPASGITYEARLAADRDVEQRVVVIDLILTRQGSALDGHNLLEPTGRWHGAEPFSLIAAEMKGGAPSRFGLSRQIPIQGSDGLLIMNIQKVEVTGCVMQANCAFSTVTVEVGMQPSQPPKVVGSLQDVRATLATTIEKRLNPEDTLRVQRLEPTVIVAAHGRADRTGNRLTLHFLNGTSRTYVTKGDCETLEGECQRYALLALVSPANFFLLHEQFYERVGCLVVDSRTGRETELPDIPYLSPDGDRFLVVNGLDGGGDYWPLQIWRRRGDAAFVEWKQRGAIPKNPVSVSAVRWDRNDRIDLTMVSESRVQPPPAGFTPGRWSATLNLTKRGWLMKPIAEQ
jgi:hypothetical protein